ncbi:MAG: YopX family protein [Chitinophagales bacterium]
MSRQIKFRWVGKNLYFNTIQIQEGITTKKIRKGETLTFFNLGNSNCEFLSEDLYTGVNDINGLEIYRGDIIKPYGENSKPMLVEYKQFNDDWSAYTGFNLDGFSNNIKIGNIYENPELLQSAQ